MLGRNDPGFKSSQMLGQSLIKQLAHATRACSQYVTEAQAADERYQSGMQKTEIDMNKPEFSNDKITIPLEATMLDTVVAAFMQEWAQSTSGYVVAARGTANQDQASITKAFMDAQLKMTQGDEQVKAAMLDFCTHPYAGVITRVFKETVTVRKPFVQQGDINPEDRMESKGTTQRGENILIPIDGEQVERIRFGMEPLNCYRLFFHSPNLATKNGQPSIHILHVVDESFVNTVANPPVDVAKVKKGASQYNLAKVGFNNTANVDNDAVEIYESWVDLASELGKLKTVGEDIDAMLEYYQIIRTPMPGDKWCVFHDANGLVLAIEENPLILQNEYPIHFGSFFPPRNGIVGKSLFYRITDICLSIEDLMNSAMWSVEKRVNPTLICSLSSRIDPEKIMKAYRTRFGILPVANLEDVESSMKFMDIPDVTAVVQAYVQMLMSFIQRIGVPDVTQGIAGADTATEAEITAGKANTRLSSPFRTFSQRVLGPALSNLRDLCVRHATTKEWVVLTGEQGVNMSRGLWAYPEDLTEQLDVIPIFTSEYSDFKQLSQQLLGLMKIGAAYGMDATAAAAMMRLIMQSMGIPQRIVDEFLGSVNGAVSVLDRLKMLEMGPGIPVRVLPNEDHKANYEVLQAWKEANPDKADWPNVVNFENATLTGLMAIEMKAAAEEQAARESEQMKAKAKADGKARETSNTQGRVRSDIVANSKDVAQSDSGVRTQEQQGGGMKEGGVAMAAGMTGQGAI
jgi:hypothetical protein